MNTESPEILAAARTLGWPGLRPLQARVVQPLLDGKDVVAVLPTSAGKSGIYQIPALARPGLVVVISPLVALMRDQVSRLRRMGVPAVALNSHLSDTERRHGIEQVRSGAIRVLYISPEKMLVMDTSILATAQVQLYAVDEAHCISEWGHDFRPSYYRLGKMLAERGFPKAQRLALTATATPDVMQEIAQVLRLDPSTSEFVRVSSDRPNIAYGVAGRQASLASMVERGGLPSIVYGSTRKGVEYAAEQLKRPGYRVGCYHAGMSSSDRTEVQAGFERGDFDIIAATCAFGMGIDHAHIRSVIHAEMPTSLEAYSQETGRAGRDGEPSIAIVRATTETLDVAKSSMERQWPTPWRIRLFWRLLSDLFQTSRSSWHGEARVQKTNEEIADLFGMDPLEVGSCLRLLVEHGHVGWTPYHERPVVVTLLSDAKRLVGARQRRVLRALEEHADVGDRVEGTVGFFQEVIGLDYAYAKELRSKNAIQFTWVDGSSDEGEGKQSRCQVLEQISSCQPEDLEMDDARISRIRKRSLDRIEAARGFLTTMECRRKYLLEYFGDSAESLPIDRCCDHCSRRAS